jgi:hypothetical protein
MKTPLPVRRRELAAQAQAQRIQLAVQCVQCSGPLRMADRVMDGVALARRHPIVSLLALLLAIRVWAPARKLGLFPLLGLIARRWMAA